MLPAKAPRPVQEAAAPREAPPPPLQGATPRPPQDAVDLRVPDDPETGPKPNPVQLDWHTCPAGRNRPENDRQPMPMVYSSFKFILRIHHLLSVFL